MQTLVLSASISSMLAAGLLGSSSCWSLARDLRTALNALLVLTAASSNWSFTSLDNKLPFGLAEI